jgi:hypothetical protein
MALRTFLCQQANRTLIARGVVGGSYRTGSVPQVRGVSCGYMVERVTGGRRGGRRESNPHYQLGKSVALPLCHLAILRPAGILLV